MTCIAAVIAVNVSRAAVGTPTNGSCGADTSNPGGVKWSFDMSTQTLTISGEGDMADYASPSEAPWYNWCNDITSLVVSDGVTHLSDYAFSMDYWQLTSVSMASSVVSIGDYAFNCVPLTSIQQPANAARQRREEAEVVKVASVLPADLQSIGDYALSGTNITSLTLPALVNNIGEGALAYNAQLTTLTCLGTMIIPWFESDILEGCSALTAIYVPELVVDDYKKVDCWLQYASLIQPISEEEQGGEEEEEPTPLDEVVSVGSGTTASSYLPSYPNCTYSMSQQIYTSDEIGKAGLITSIAFYNYDTGSERNYDIYLSHTSKTAFDSSTDWVTVAESNKVFSGTVWLAQGVWTVIDLDTPFQYNGTQSLLITVDDNTGKETGSSYGIRTYSGSENQALYYYKMFGTPINLDPTQAITEEGSIYYRKNCIQLCFETYPKPYKLEAVEVGDVSAQIQCSLRGDATAWNLRYRKVGDEEWTTLNDLTTRSELLEELTPATQYEAQVQAIFEGDHLSDWTTTLQFTTSCCPVEEQANLIFVLRSNNYVGWFGFAVQIMDITDEDNPVEVAYLHTPTYAEPYQGTIPLCCGHEYQVNWIYDSDYAVYNKGKSFSLYFEPGDLIYSMGYGEAPEETAKLTTFVMDCTPYCAQKPTNLTVDNTTFESATLSFTSSTQVGEVAYSTSADFTPDMATPSSVNFTKMEASTDPLGTTSNNSSLTLTGLEPLTTYYVSVRNVCIDALTGEPTGNSRWSDPIKVTTGSRYDAPTQITAEPINSRTEKLTWGSRGNEKKVNLYYREQATGTAVDASAVQTFGDKSDGGNGTGFKENGGWGEGIWYSSGTHPYSNVLFVSNVPAGSSFGFKAGNGKTGAGNTTFHYGLVRQTEATPLEQMKKFNRECLNDAEREARIKNLDEQIAQNNNTLNGLYNQLTNPSLSDEEVAELQAQIAEYEQANEDLEAEKTTLESLPTDAEKLESMKDLDKQIELNNNTLNGLYNQLTNPSLSDAEVAELRAQIAALENSNDVLSAQKEAMESSSLSEAEKQEQMKEIDQKIAQNNNTLNGLYNQLTNPSLSDAKVAELQAQIDALEKESDGYLSQLNNLRARTSFAENVNKDGFSVNADANQSGAEAKPRRAEEVNNTYIFFIRHTNDNGVLLVKDLTITPPERVGGWTCIPNIVGTSYTLTGLEPGTAYEVMVEPIYEDGMTGTQSPVTVFTTLGAETDPVDGEFSVAENKKVQFAHGNLRCEGERYEDEWSMATQQYEILGEENIDVSGSRSYPAWLVDLLCWSTTTNYYGVSNYYYYDDEDAAPYFKGDFVDWGENPVLIADLGPGWSTLSKDEWNYLLNERENAAQLKSFATVAGVRGLVLLPDEWTAPDGVLLKDEITAEEWAIIEQTGVVFLPAAGQLTTTYDNWIATTTVTEAGTYWTSTPSDDESGLKSWVLTIGEDEVTLDADLHRRVATAVRLVKVCGPSKLILDEHEDNSEAIAEANGEVRDVILKRTLKAGGYSSFAVPFDVSAEQVEAVLGADVKVKQLTGSSFDEGTLSLTFADATGIEAGKPYLVKMVDEMESATFAGVTLNSTLTPTLTSCVDFVPTVGKTLISGPAGNEDDTQSVLFLAAGNSLYHPTVVNKEDDANSYMLGFRAYFQLHDAVTSAKAFSIDFGDGEATGIISVGDAQLSIDNAGAWYTLDGRRISGVPTLKGVYIQNGKKVLIK